MELSIIIPFHNGGDPFYRCLEALNTSTHVPGEVIVVDDASTDAYLDIAHRFNVRILELKDGPQGLQPRAIAAPKLHAGIFSFFSTPMSSFTP